jgi:hypothetical protein
VGDSGFWNDCQINRYDFLDSSCTYQSATRDVRSHAIYEISVGDFSVVGGAGPTPEVSAPHSLSLIGLGLLGLALRRFKKQTI